MISKRILKKYRVETIDDYFKLIVSSFDNNNFFMVSKLTKIMNKKQKQDFYYFLFALDFDKNLFNLVGYLLR
jgi:hypothetical protein